MNYAEEKLYRTALQQLTRIADSLEKIASYMEPVEITTEEKPQETKVEEVKVPEKIESHYVVAALYDTAIDSSIALTKLYDILNGMGIPTDRYPYNLELPNNLLCTEYGDIWFLYENGRKIRDDFKADQVFGFPIGMELKLNKSGRLTEGDRSRWKENFFNYVINQEVIRRSK